jgi:acyl-homoserine lactone acylase PvdQ
MTDAKGIMRIHLRDFRPQVAALLSIRRKDLANMITQDYLDAYAEGFNAYIHDLSLITLASRETKPSSNTRKRDLKTL